MYVCYYGMFAIRYVCYMVCLLCGMFVMRFVCYMVYFYMVCLLHGKFVICYVCYMLCLLYGLSDSTFQHCRSFIFLKIHSIVQIVLLDF